MAFKSNVAVNTAAVVLPAGETVEQAIARLTAENQALQAQVANARVPGKISCKITTGRAPGTLGPNDQGEKSTGALVFSGFGKFPKTFYDDELTRFEAYLASPEFKTFRKINAALLSHKA